MTAHSLIALEDRAKVTKDRNIEEKCREFGKRLEAAMEKREMTQSQLARLMGVSRSAVNWWVQGKTYPSIENAERLADLLRVTPEYLIFNVVTTTSDRLSTPVPVFTKVDGQPIEITSVSLPREFIARSIPHAGELKAATVASDEDMYENHDAIVIADTKQKAISKEPQRMLIDFGDKYGAATICRVNRKYLVQDDGSKTKQMMSPSQFHIVGKVVAEVVTG